MMQRLILLLALCVLSLTPLFADTWWTEKKPPQVDDTREWDVKDETLIIHATDLFQYGGHWYLKFHDKTLWQISPQVGGELKEEEAKEHKFEMIRSHDNGYPYYYYTAEASLAYFVALFVTDYDRVRIRIPLDTYKFVSATIEAKAVIELDNLFNWTVDEKEVPEFIWDWQEGESIVIAVKYCDNGLRFIREQTFLYNLDRDEHVFAQPAEI